MKTVFVDCSPKKNLSASGFVASYTAFFTRGETVKLPLKRKSDLPQLLSALENADNLVFAMPLYVDGIPSHVLPLLKGLEHWCLENRKSFTVYAIANNGFIEGRQNEPLFLQLENFSRRSGLQWKGGLGIGGGVMMNVMRIMILVVFGVFLMNMVLCLSSGESPRESILNMVENVAEVLVLGCGIITYDLALARAIGKGKAYGRRYTRIMVPSFVFILFADIFFLIVSFFNGGLFRGWLRRKRPSKG